MQTDYGKKMTEKRGVIDKLNAYQLYFENLSKNMHRLSAKNKTLKEQMTKFDKNEELLKTKVFLDLQLLSEVMDCLKCKFFVSNQFKESFCHKLKEINDCIYYTQDFKFEIAEILGNEDIVMSEEKYREFFGFEGNLGDNISVSPAHNSHATIGSSSLRSLSKSYVRSKQSNKMTAPRITTKQNKKVQQYILNNAVVELFFDELKDDFFDDFNDYYTKTCVDIEIQFSSYDFNKRLASLKRKHIEQLEEQKNAKSEPEQSMELSILFVEQLKSRWETMKSRNDKYLEEIQLLVGLLHLAFEMSREAVVNKSINRNLTLIMALSKDKNNRIDPQIIQDPKRGQTSVKLRSAILKLMSDNTTQLLERNFTQEYELQKWYINKVGLQLAHIKDVETIGQFMEDNVFDVARYLDYANSLLVERFRFNMSIYETKVLQMIIFVNKVCVFSVDPFAGKECRDFVTNVKLNLKRLNLKGKVMAGQNNKVTGTKNFFMTKRRENGEGNQEADEEVKVNFLRNNRQDNLYIKDKLMDILESDRANKSHSLDKSRNKLKKTIKERLNKSMQFYEVINENYKVLNKLKDSKLNSPAKDHGAAC